jgi:predicted Zn-ribbon and HTH transcriptional regulator
MSQETKYRIFTSENVILFVIALAMLNNVEHLAYVHHSIARLSFPYEWMNKVHSVIVVLILEVIIITLAHYGQRTFAGFYTFLLLCLQLIYYPLADYIADGEWGKFFAAVIYSTMFTVSIYYFSIMAAKRQELAARRDEFRTKYFEAKKELEESERSTQQIKIKLHETEEAYHVKNEFCTEMSEDKKALASELHQVQKELQELRLFRQQTLSACTCPKCGTGFESEASKRSHMGKCKGNVKPLEKAA